MSEKRDEPYILYIKYSDIGVLEEEEEKESPKEFHIESIIKHRYIQDWQFTLNFSTNFKVEDTMSLIFALCGHVTLTKSNFFFLLESLMQLKCVDLINEFKQVI